ncbi:MAG TPA: D-alanyl-D-alanine carboxypeptidase, partial [Polyangiaceae bacterium]|nr:D-alanyl-D-alanine carboxypeptidase [Polyangiaceae bacterium]
MTWAVHQPPAALTRRCFLVALSALGLAPAAGAAIDPERLGRSLAPELDGAVRWAEGVGARLGACIIDVESGVELAGAAAGVAENPASNQKLVTAGALLKNLGPERTFATGLYGRIVRGRVDPLVLRGEGDP